MVKISFLYPYREQGRFDTDYYATRHMPLAARLLGDALRGWSVDIGVNAGRPNTPPPFVAAGHFLFDDVDAYYAAFRPHARTLSEDIPNYTDGGGATILVSEVKASV